jgi:phosphoribosylformylglycinamidine cyclo-ligase
MSSPVGEELLIPTRLYVKPVTEIQEHFHDNPVHGLSHITGGSFTKLSRLNKRVKYILDNLPSAKGIFKQIQSDGRLDLPEMYRTFNMGIGFCVLLPRGSVERVIRIFEKYHMNCFQIGRVKGKGSGEVIANLGRKNRIL